MDKKQLEKLQVLLQEMVDKRFASGANCLVIQGGEEQAYYQAGLADIEQGRTLQRDTIFRLYSMTKPITAVAVMQLLEDGKIDLAVPVSNYLPGYEKLTVWKNHTAVPVTKTLTVRHLLDMTSGFTYEGIADESEKRMGAVFAKIKEKMHGEEALGTIEIAEKMATVPLAFEPGELFRYGVSADILGALVEAVSGESFGDYLKYHIFEPLGMEDTAFYVPHEKQSRLAKVYEQTEEGLKLYTEDNLGISNTMEKAPAFESGGAGLVSTIDDYAKFNRMLLQKGSLEGKTVLRPETVAFLSGSYITETQAKGMEGWESLPGFRYGNLNRIMVYPEQAVTLSSKGEYGWDGWLGCYMMVDPAHDLTILAMYQRKDSGTTEYTRRMRNIVFSALD